MATRITISTNIKEKAIRMMKADDVYRTLWEFDQWLRSQIKHHDRDIQDVRDKLYDCMGCEGISFEDYE